MYIYDLYAINVLITFSTVFITNVEDVIIIYNVQADFIATI